MEGNSKSFPDRMKQLLLCVFLSLFIISACTSSMRQIEYGKDNCEFCRMTVMDPRFASGILTSKGRVYTFDSEECLANYVKEKGFSEKDQYFVSDYTRPGTLIEATGAIYLHSDSIQSPMGGNLGAFIDQSSALSCQKELGGELLKWSQLTGRK